MEIYIPDLKLNFSLKKDFLSIKLISIFTILSILNPSELDHSLIRLFVLFISLPVSLSLCNCVSLSVFHLELHYHFPLLLLLLFLSLFICSHIRISNFRMDSISLSRMPKYESIDPLPIVLYPMLTYFIRNNLFAKNEKQKQKQYIKQKSCISIYTLLYVF